MQRLRLCNPASADCEVGTAPCSRGRPCALLLSGKVMQGPLLCWNGSQARAETVETWLEAGTHPISWQLLPRMKGMEAQ